MNMTSLHGNIDSAKPKELNVRSRIPISSSTRITARRHLKHTANPVVVCALLLLSMVCLGSPVQAGYSIVVWGSDNPQLSPPSGLENPVAIAAGDFYSLALKADGTVVGFGNDFWGSANPPSGLSGVVAIDAASGSGGAWTHSVALKRDGTVVAWGNDDFDQTTPPSGLDGVVDIAIGYNFSLALKSDGTVVSWGSGAGATLPSGLEDVMEIAVGSTHSLALKADGTVVGWGNDGHGQATPPSGLSDVVAISAGNNFSLALKSDGTVVAWGSGSAVTPPTGLDDVVAVSASVGHALALKSDGTVVGWGWDNEGQATPPSGLDNVVAITAGANHSIALVSDLCATPSLEWSFEDEGFINGGQNGEDRQYDHPSEDAASPWDLRQPAGSALTLLRLSFEDDGNCAMHNPFTQEAFSVLTVNVPSVSGCDTIRLVMSWYGEGELEDAGFDEMTVFLNSQQEMYAQSRNENQACGDSSCAPRGEVQSQEPFQLYFDLSPGQHVLDFEGSTVDYQFHCGAFYHFALHFESTPE